MNQKLILALALVLLALGCTDGFDESLIGRELNHSDIFAIPSCMNSSSIEDIVPTHLIQDLATQNLTATKHIGSNWTIKDDNIRGIIIDYHYGGKQWKYITIDGATCHRIPCIFSGAYCLECEEIRGD